MDWRRYRTAVAPDNECSRGDCHDRATTEICWGKIAHTVDKLCDHHGQTLMDMTRTGIIRPVIWVEKL